MIEDLAYLRESLFLNKVMKTGNKCKKNNSKLYLNYLQVSRFLTDQTVVVKDKMLNENFT